MGFSKKPQLGFLLQFLIPLAMLGAVGSVIYLVLRPGGGPSPLVLGGVLALVFGWVGVSVLWPSRADRKCPQCQAESLERLDPMGAVGVICQQCGWSDETASAWYMAEEELEALEPLAMEKRLNRRARPQADLDMGSSSD
jgi:hypothetical protein